MSSRLVCMMKMASILLPCFLFPILSLPKFLPCEHCPTVTWALTSFLNHLLNLVGCTFTVSFLVTCSFLLCLLSLRPSAVSIPDWLLTQEEPRLDLNSLPYNPRLSKARIIGLLDDTLCLRPVFLNTVLVLFLLIHQLTYQMRLSFLSNYARKREPYFYLLGLMTCILHRQSD